MGIGASGDEKYHPLLQAAADAWGGAGSDGAAWAGTGGRASGPVPRAAASEGRKEQALRERFVDERRESLEGQRRRWGPSGPHRGGAVGAVREVSRRRLPGWGQDAGASRPPEPLPERQGEGERS